MSQGSTPELRESYIIAGVPDQRLGQLLVDASVRVANTDIGETQFTLQINDPEGARPHITFAQVSASPGQIDQLSRGLAQVADSFAGPFDLEAVKLAGGAGFFNILYKDRETNTRLLRQGLFLFAGSLGIELAPEPSSMYARLKEKQRSGKLEEDERVSLNNLGTMGSKDTHATITKIGPEGVDLDSEQRAQVSRAILAGGSLSVQDFNGSLVAVTINRMGRFGTLRQPVARVALRG